MNEAFINSLKYRLTLPLPGKEAQFRMAASFRQYIPQNTIEINAGVLLLFYPHQNELYTILTKRPEYQGVHSGQISFPGGKYEPVDNNDLIATALREAREEIGVIPEQINVLGKLTPLYIPVSKTEVFPVVGFSEFRPQFIADPYEVDSLLEFAVSDLFNPAIRQEKPYSHGEYTGTVPYFNIQGHHVWGATAMIMNEFLEILNELNYKSILS